MSSLAVATPAATLSYINLSGEHTHQGTTVESLHELPQQLSLTPVKGKRPYLPNWQNNPLTRGQIEHQILANGATGFGMLTGSASGGIIAIDIDGTLADAKLNEISEGELSETPAWTSGKAGCRQIAYQLSKPIQKVLEASGFTRHFFDCDGGQQLDFRYNGCQSVLPPSQHPETGQYEWITPFSDCDIAPAPTWLESLLVEWAIAAQPKPTPIKKGRQRQKTFNLTDRMRWNGPGCSNNALGAIGAYVIEVEGITDKIEAETRAWEIANENGYQQYASRDEKADIGHLRRWIECRLKKGDVTPLGRVTGAGDPRLNDQRSADSRYRFDLAKEAAKAEGVMFSSFNQAFKWFNAWLRKNNLATIGTGSWKKLRHLAANVAAILSHTVDQRKRSAPLDIARLSGTVSPPQPSPKLTLLTWQAIAIATAPSAASSKTKPAFSKGDRVIVDDQTGLPYCGKECTITAVLPDGTYRLNINYQGKRLRPLQRKQAVEALPSFLRPVSPMAAAPPETPEAEVWVTAADIQKADIPASHWLYAICGAAAQRIKRNEVEPNIWKALLSLQCEHMPIQEYAHRPSFPIQPTGSA